MASARSWTPAPLPDPSKVKKYIQAEDLPFVRDIAESASTFRSDLPPTNELDNLSNNKARKLFRKVAKAVLGLIRPRNATRGIAAGQVPLLALSTTDEILPTVLNDMINFMNPLSADLYRYVLAFTTGIKPSLQTVEGLRHTPLVKGRCVRGVGFGTYLNAVLSLVLTEEQLKQNGELWQDAAWGDAHARIKSAPPTPPISSAQAGPSASISPRAPLTRPNSKPVPGMWSSLVADSPDLDLDIRQMASTFSIVLAKLRKQLGIVGNPTMAEHKHSTFIELQYFEAMRIVNLIVYSGLGRSQTIPGGVFLCPMDRLFFNHWTNARARPQLISGLVNDAATGTTNLKACLSVPSLLIPADTPLSLLYLNRLVDLHEELLIQLTSTLANLDALKPVFAFAPDLAEAVEDRHINSNVLSANNKQGGERGAGLGGGVPKTMGDLEKRRASGKQAAQTREDRGKGNSLPNWRDNAAPEKVKATTAKINKPKNNSFKIFNHSGVDYRFQSAAVTEPAGAYWFHLVLEKITSADKFELRIYRDKANTEPPICGELHATVYSLGKVKDAYRRKIGATPNMTSPKGLVKLLVDRIAAVADRLNKLGDDEQPDQLNQLNKNKQLDKHEQLDEVHDNEQLDLVGNYDFSTLGEDEDESNKLGMDHDKEEQQNLSLYAGEANKDNFALDTDFGAASISLCPSDPLSPAGGGHKSNDEGYFQDVAAGLTGKAPNSAGIDMGGVLDRNSEEEDNLDTILDHIYGTHATASDRLAADLGNATTHSHVSPPLQSSSSSVECPSGSSSGNLGLSSSAYIANIGGPSLSSTASAGS
ncbi:hypothetical protein JCM8097_002885 [Rhodosporidiobolus ruineniae]